VTRVSIALALALGLAACAPALREPPPLSELAGARAEDDPMDAGERIREADRLWNDRTVVAVREASRLYLGAAEEARDPAVPLVGAVRANVWLSDHEAVGTTREESAVRAVQAAQWCGRARPGDPVCDYWLAVALGVQARERHSTGLDALPRIVELLESAVAEAPELDEAGPHRVLALVLLRAPGWPRGPGDPDLGLEHAREAVRLRPDYAPNLLALAEALEKTDQPAESLEVYRRAAAMAEQAVRAGVAGAGEWLDDARSKVSPD
jgi:hypothetical protein